jgi:dihydrofolate reductase
MPDLCLIAAVGKNAEIGKDGALPWRLSEDLKRFKAITTGHAVIMGRKTFESIGRPLPNRRNIVVTRSTPELPEGVERASSIEAAIALARQTDAEPMVIGGGEIYKATIAEATRLEITEVAQEVPGADAFFPPIDRARFEESARTNAETEGVTFVTYRARG